MPDLFKFELRDEFKQMLKEHKLVYIIDEASKCLYVQDNNLLQLLTTIFGNLVDHVYLAIKFGDVPFLLDEVIRRIETGYNPAGSYQCKFSTIFPILIDFRGGNKVLIDASNVLSILKLNITSEYY